MPLAAHVMHAAAGLPTDEATRPELVDFGAKNLRNENVRQLVRGALTKRTGFSLTMPLGRSDATSATAGYKLFGSRTRAVRITDLLQAEVYSSQSQAWTSLGRVAEATSRLIDLPSMGTSAVLQDIDITNGYVAVSWMSTVVGTASCSSYLAIVDQATGGVVRVPELVGTSTANWPAMLAVQGNYFVAVRYHATGTKLEAWALDTTSAATIALGWVAFGASLATDATSNTIALQSLPHASTPRVAVAYVNSSGGASQITVKAFNVSGVVQTQTIGTSGITPFALGLGGNATDTLWLVWGEGVNVRARGLTPFTITADLATVATVGIMAVSAIFIAVAPSSTAGQARWWANDNSASTQAQMRGIKTTAGAAATNGTQMTIAGVAMVRKPFNLNGRFFSAFFNCKSGGGSGANNPDSNFFVADWTDDVNTLRPLANPAPGLSPSSTVLTSLQPAGKFVAGTTSTTLLVGLPIKRSSVADGTSLLEIDFANGKRWQAVAHANTTILSAAVPQSFDGARAAEIGFLYRPPVPSTATSGTGISAATGWRYVAVYEETDSDGNWHVSGVSDPSPSTGVVANKTVTVTSIPLAITSRQTSTGSSARGVRVAWYRTLDGGVAPYYRLGTTINDATAVTVTFADTVTDAILAANAKIYSQPGVVGTNQDRRSPPSFQCLVSYNGMLVGASGSDIWYSGQNVSGEATWFNPIFQIPIPGDGDITALAVLDGGLFVFKRRDIYAIAGDPPSDNGTSGGLGAPRRLASDVGCIDSRSTCTTSLGIFFQSERGIEVLTRALAVEWVGEAIDTTVDAFPICTSITVEPLANVVIVELAASESAGQVTGSGCAEVFDLSMKGWVSKDRRTTVTGADQPAQSAYIIYVAGAYRYAWLDTSGRIFYETPGTSLDAGVYWITSLYETASAKHGLQQEQMVWSAIALFEAAGAAGMKVEIGYDYAPYSAANDKVWTEAAVLGQRQLDWRPKTRGQSMRFRISDTAPAVLGSGLGLTFIGMSLDTAPKQGATTGTPRLATSLRR